MDKDLGVLLFVVVVICYSFHLRLKCQTRLHSCVVFCLKPRNCEQIRVASHRNDVYMNAL